MTLQTTEIERAIRAFLVDTFLFGRNDHLGDDDPLMDKVIDSHGVLELVVFLQDRFGMDVPDEDVTTDNLDSVRKLVAYVTRKFAGNQ